MLSGWAGSGKDAAATLLCEEFGFQRAAFADALKEDVAAATGIPVALFHDTAAKDYPLEGVEPRSLLIQHALVARATDPDIYSRRVAELLSTTGAQRTVISDWRYPREYEYLRRTIPDAKFIRVRIVRPTVTQRNTDSEKALDGEPMDIVIHNYAGIAGLRDALKELMVRLGSTHNVMG
jgi:hypothetical protein